MGNGGNAIFRGMSPKIPGNVAKDSGECCQTFLGMSTNIPGNTLKHILLLTNDASKR